jgi:poly(ADP-ribose) glycohydrolase ARH3
MLHPRPATRSRDAIRGCILGGVVGDAFGAPLEGASLTGIGPLVERRSRSRAPWGYTDDSVMLLACAESLVGMGTVEPVSLLDSLARHYEPARGFGRGMKMAVRAFASGTHWSRCAFAAWPAGSRGNGGATRIPPVAVARWGSPEAFDGAVRLATRVTHAHEHAVTFARLQAVAIARVLDEPALVDAPDAFHEALARRLAPSPPVLADRMDAVFRLVARSATAVEAAHALGTGTTAVESVPAALWSFVSRHASFAEAVSSAALLGGDVDSICCLVGALAGALHGAQGIEAAWLENLAHEHPSLERFRELADALHVLTPTSPRDP